MKTDTKISKPIIKVDKDGDGIMVYMVPEDVQPERWFWRDQYATASSWEFAAEKYAAKRATEQGCDYACNYQ